MRRCDVCGKWFALSKEHIYQVSEPYSVSGMSIDTIRVLDAMDCPHCGCQTLLKVRMPKFVKGGAKNDV